MTHNLWCGEKVLKASNCGFLIGLIKHQVNATYQVIELSPKNSTMKMD